MKEETLMKEFRELRECLASIDKTLAVNTKQLEIHMLRSASLEKEVRILEKTQNRFMGAVILAQILVPIALKYLL